MVDQTVAEFYGGPLDGQHLLVPDLRPAWLVSCGPSPAALWYGPASPSMSGCLVYTLAVEASTGRPQRNPAGRYRYEFGGYR